MSRQIKYRKKAVAKKATKGHNSGKHFGENGKAQSHFPGDQPAPSWVRPTGAKGWFNAPKKDAPKKETKPKPVRPKGQIPHF